MAYSVQLSAKAEAALLAIARSDRQRCGHLALMLVSLEKTPRPARSRLLAADAEGEDRVWRLAGFRIAYRVHDTEKLVEVGPIDRRE